MRSTLTPGPNFRDHLYRISTGKFNNVTLVHGGASSSVGGLCRNDNPTRGTASFQILKTPDSVIAPATRKAASKTSCNGASIMRQAWRAMQRGRSYD